MHLIKQNADGITFIFTKEPVEKTSFEYKLDAADLLGLDKETVINEALTRQMAEKGTIMLTMIIVF